MPNEHDTISALNTGIRLLQAGMISEEEFYVLASCLRTTAATWKPAQ